MSSSSITVSATATTIAIPKSTFISDDPVASRTSYLSSTSTTLIACIIPIIAMMYLVVLSWAYQYARKSPKALNKTSGVWLQKYAPVAYIFLVLSSLTEVAMTSWLVLQYNFNHNYPSIEMRTGARLLLFTSIWTSLTAGAYTLLFLHPAWSKHPVASVGAQAIWVFITWLFWVVGASIVNKTVSSLVGEKACGSVAYCAQIRGLFAIAVVESLTLTAGMVAMLWLAWQSTRYAREPMSFPRVGRFIPVMPFTTLEKIRTALSIGRAK